MPKTKQIYLIHYKKDGKDSLKYAIGGEQRDDIVSDLKTKGYSNIISKKKR